MVLATWEQKKNRPYVAAGEFGCFLEWLRTTQDVLQNIFCVQSPQHASEYLANCINKFLVEKRADVKALKDEDFETVKGAVHTIIAEKDIKLSYESSRFWNQITAHKYNFKKQAQMVEALAGITKAEFIAHFEKVFFSD